MPFGEPIGQGWLQLGELGLAFVLSAFIGLEREFNQKSAGLRTCTLVGLSSALIILISKYGFTNILESNRIVLDPSRIAAQVVSGIGFIGGGIIFVRKDLVRGLTTAATVWLTSAVGMACGAGLPVLALVVTSGHFVVVAIFPYLERRLPKSRWAPTRFQVSYQDGRGILREILVVCTQKDLSVTRVQIGPDAVSDGHQLGKGSGKLSMLGDEEVSDESEGKPSTSLPVGSKGIVRVVLDVSGVRSVAKLITKLSSIKGVVAVQANGGNVTAE
jgi:putative Mg2+ transporter-C (MgtC) family protein